MSKDYKPAPAKPKSKGHPFLSGMLVGLLVGIAASLGVVLLVKQGGSAFQEKSNPAAEISAPVKPAETPNTAKQDSPHTDPSATKKEDRFTFYGILTGSESPVTEQEVKQATEKNTKPDAGVSNDKPPSESYFLQIGAYQTEQEADNAKAKLALIGLEAVIQTANIPDKGILHRVRVGPLSNVEEINKARTDLAKNGFNADLIKIHSTVPDQ